MTREDALAVLAFGGLLLLLWAALHLEVVMR